MYRVLEGLQNMFQNTVNSRVGDTLWVFSISVANAGGRPGESFEQQRRMVTQRATFNHMNRIAFFVTVVLI